MGSVAPLITSLARQLGLDPAAVIAVARGEGGLANREGDIGDLAGGGSFGPFQMYSKGALPGSVRARGSQFSDQWAWSPAGIRFALSKMAPFARGRTGADAVRQIISRFERPANPQASIAAALGRLGMPGAVGPVRGVPGSGALPTQAPGGSDKLAQIQAMFQNRGQGPLRMLQALQAAAPQTPPGASVSPSGAIPPPGGGTGGFNPVELFYDPLGAFKNGQAIHAIGGHSDHVHAAFSNAQQVRRAIALAQRLGLRVSENPLVDHVDPVHVKNSYHYRTLAPGVGAAMDVSGPAAVMARFYRSLAPRSKK